MSSPSTQEANSIVGLAALGYGVHEINVALNHGLRAVETVRQVMSRLNDAGAPPEIYDRARDLLLRHASIGFKASSTDEILSSLTDQGAMASQ